MYNCTWSYPDLDVFSVSGSASLSFSAESFTYSWPVESQAASKKETEHGQGFHFCRIDEYRALHSWPKNGAYRERLLIINTVYISWGYKIRKNCAFMTPSVLSINLMIFLRSCSSYRRYISNKACFHIMRATYTDTLNIVYVTLKIGFKWQESFYVFFYILRIFTQACILRNAKELQACFRETLIHFTRFNPTYIVTIGSDSETVTEGLKHKFPQHSCSVAFYSNSL